MLQNWLPIECRFYISCCSLSGIFDNQAMVAMVISLNFPQLCFQTSFLTLNSSLTFARLLNLRYALLHLSLFLLQC